MASIGGFDIPINAPSLGLGSTSWFLIVLIFFILIVGGIAIFFMGRLKVYNKKIIVFENIAGAGYQVSFRDRAKTVKLGDSGEELMYLMKKKVFRNAYGRKMGKNTYWFAVGQDGYWYNVVLGDIDAKKGMLDIEPIDRDMRYMHVAIRRNIQDRYRKPKFMEKYATYVMSAIFLLIMIVGIWFLLDKMADMNSNNIEAIKTSEKLSEANKKIVVALSNLLNSNSGIVPVG